MSNLFFDGLPIWFINLDMSVDRKKKMIDQLNDLGITEYKIISAIDGVSNQLHIPNKNEGHARELSSGEVGAVLSFFKLLNQFILSDKDYVMMCDDDVDLTISKKINFNFFETLAYHNPNKYSLKLNSMWIDDYVHTHIPFGSFLKPQHLLYGNMTIVNKAWAKEFLTKYKALGINIDNSFIYDPSNYNLNFGSAPLEVYPTCDSINFDEHTFLWRVFSVTEEDSIISNHKGQDIAKSWNKGMVLIDDIDVISINSFANSVRNLV